MWIFTFFEGKTVAIPHKPPHRTLVSPAWMKIVDKFTRSDVCPTWSVSRRQQRLCAKTCHAIFEALLHDRVSRCSFLCSVCPRLLYVLRRWLHATVSSLAFFRLRLSACCRCYRTSLAQTLRWPFQRWDGRCYVIAPFALEGSLKNVSRNTFPFTFLPLKQKCNNSQF